MKGIYSFYLIFFLFRFVLEVVQVEILQVFLQVNCSVFTFFNIF